MISNYGKQAEVKGEAAGKREPVVTKSGKGKGSMK